MSVSLIIITSSIPIHPSTKVIDATINSLINIYDYDEVIIGYDTQKQENTLEYVEYMERMKEKYPTFTHLNHGTPVHYVGNFYKCLEYCKTPYFVLSNHDAELIGTIPITTILNYNFDWKIIFTHHLKNDLLNPTHWFPIITPFNNELIKSFGWSERIFLSKKQFWLDLALYNGNPRQTSTFTDIIYHRQFTRMFKKNENINSYKLITKPNEKIYSDYWEKWKCFALHSEIGYHKHLCGRTLSVKK